MDAQESGKRDDPPDASRQPSRRRHLLIAGTGRSGTSALVQYLTRLGLETHLSKNSESRQWSNASQSGFEDIPMSAIDSELPYVIKFPWAYEFIEDLLVDPQIELEAVILPMRDLMKAAASRTIVQLQAVHDHAPWMAKLPKTWEDWALTPGGTIFSLNPVDQARLLAVGFHRLLERLVQTDIPIVVLAFPRLVTDPDYLFQKLRPILPVEISVERARKAHAASFSSHLVRVEQELSDAAMPGPGGEGQVPDHTVLDNMALRRHLAQLRDQFSEAEATRAALEARERDLAQAISDLQNQLGLARHDLAGAQTRADENVARAAEAEFRATAAEARRLAVETSTTWRVTRSLRNIRNYLAQRRSDGRKLRKLNHLAQPWIACERSRGFAAHGRRGRLINLVPRAAGWQQRADRFRARAR